MHPEGLASLSKSAIGRFSRMVGGATTLRRTGRFLTRELWIRPIIAALILGTAGWFVYRSVEAALHSQRVDVLATILDADVAALRAWMHDQQAIAELIARDEQLAGPIRELAALEGKPDAERQLIQAKGQAELRKRLGAAVAGRDFSGFLVVSPSSVVLAADQDAPIGKPIPGERKEFFAGVLKGKSAISKPFRSTLLLRDSDGELKAGLPTMFAAAAVAGEAGAPLAAVGLRIRPEDHFTRILQVARSGKTGETFAFDRDGLFLSMSRFDEDLKQIGLLVDQPEVKSILNLELRDPGVDMMKGKRPTLRRNQQPLTRMAADAVEGNSGVDADGYRDYRGVPVVGAWTWLENLDFGVCFEIEVSEAFRPAYILRTAISSLIGMLVGASVAIFVVMSYMSRKHRALQSAALEARRLGQYQLEEKIGAGGMGAVYRARHAMLRRPTAVKLLDAENVSETSIARFEREVQLTSGLSHPNTVAIFDYGRTPEGIFYYAMEYLEGMTLDDLVKKHGPLPEGRALYILRQVCGALGEAHAAGLVHRDVKPANVFLTCRGGMYDFVKVLDFGLVKAVDGSGAANVSSVNAVAGTPLYLSPEAVNQPDRVDARSDVYSIGALGYFLLTGTPVFTGESVMEICMKHIQAEPESPSARLGRPIQPAFERLLLRCLAKSPDERPQNASDLLLRLADLHAEQPWTATDAASWWASLRRRYAEEAAQATTAWPSSGATEVLTGEATAAYEAGPGIASE